MNEDDYDPEADMAGSYAEAIGAIRERVKAGEPMRREGYFAPVGDYASFLDRKSQFGAQSGFSPLWLPDFLFDFQKDLTDWAIRRGRCALFADCGLGKTPMQLVWSENIVRKTNSRVLILTPLAVGVQTAKEAAKFGIPVSRSKIGLHGPLASIVVTNYESLHHFDPGDFAGVVCDESSILKNFDGARRSEITEFMRKLPYRLLCTATAAPNDFTELGTSAEALGELGHMDMLNRFFVNQNNTSDTKGQWRGHSAPRQWEGKLWRFKGHAELPFWQWVASWSRSVRRPSDLGFENGDFILPPLIERQHQIDIDTPPTDMLFSLPAVGLQEQRQERRRSLMHRCGRLAELVGASAQALVWCHLNQEGEILSQMIPGSREVAGSDPDEAKEEAFCDFAEGRLRALITKPRIGAWGMNFQNCNRVFSFPSHSFEQYYQGVRRCWRFGQRKPVESHIVTTEGEKSVLVNLQRKAAACDLMFDNLVSQTGLAIHAAQSFDIEERVPSWL